MTAETARFTFSLDDRSLALLLDEALYPLDAIYGAAYLFVDRCYVFLDRPADQQVQVRFRTKSDSTEQDLEALAGEFANELLNQVLRLRISESTKNIREYTLARAFFGDSSQASIDALLAELGVEKTTGESTCPSSSCQRNVRALPPRAGPFSNRATG